MLIDDETKMLVMGHEVKRIEREDLFLQVDENRKRQGRRPSRSRSCRVVQWGSERGSLATSRRIQETTEKRLASQTW